MKARAQLGSLLFLLLACTERPDSDLFSDGPAPSPGDGFGGSHAGTTATPTNAGMAAGESADNGGSGTLMPSGGVAGVAAAAGTASDAGAPNPLDSAGAAGAGGEPLPEPAVCGNGKLEAGEQCDDGGKTDGDGCSPECQVVCSDFGEDVVKSDDLHCYAGYDEADFEGAVAACQQRGGYLVTIGSETENALVRELVRTSKWIGAFEDVSLTSQLAGEYVWVSGEPFSFENWDARQPDRAASRCNTNASINNGRCYEHCAAMQGDGSWADARCDSSDGYVCEWEPSGS